MAQPSPRQLCELNRERQLIEQEIFAQCLDNAGAAARIEPTRHRTGRTQRGTRVSSASWPPGSAERFSVPAFMICLDEENRGKGSCRCYGGFNLFKALEAVR